MQSLDGALCLNCIHVILLPVAQSQILTVLLIHLTQVLQICQMREISIISCAAAELSPVLQIIMKGTDWLVGQ